MKKLILFLLLATTMSVFGQVDAVAPKYDLTRPNPKTTAQIQSMTRMQEGSEAWNTETKTIWRYDGTTWGDTGVALTAAEIETLLDIYYGGQTWREDAKTRIDTEYPNLDVDGTDDVNLTGNQSIAGAKTFDWANTYFNGRLNLLPTAANTFNPGYGNVSMDGSYNLRVVGNGLASTYILDGSNITAQRTITWPDKSGTPAFLDDIVGGNPLLPIYIIPTTIDTTDAAYEDAIVNNSYIANYAITLADDADYDHPDGTILRFYLDDSESSITISHSTIADVFLKNSGDYAEFLKESADTWRVLNVDNSNSKYDGLTYMRQRDLSPVSNTTDGYYEGALVYSDTAGNYDVTIASDVTYNHKNGTVLWFYGTSTSDITFAEDTGVTVTGLPVGAWSGGLIGIRKEAANTWSVISKAVGFNGSNTDVVLDDGSTKPVTDLDQSLEVTVNSEAIGTLQTTQDSIVTVLSTVPTSLYSIFEYTTAQTITSEHLKDDAIVVMEDADFTIDADSIAAYQSVRIIADDASASVSNILEGTGVSILGYTDGIELSGYPSGVTLVRKNTNTAPIELIVADYFGTIADYLAFTGIMGDQWGSALFPASTTAPSFINNISGTISEETTTTFSSTSALNYDGSGGDGAYFEPTLTDTYAASDVIRFKAKLYIVSDDASNRIRMYDATTGFTAENINGLSTGVWLDVQFDHTLGQSSGFRIYGGGGGEFILDQIELIKNP